MISRAGIEHLGLLLVLAAEFNAADRHSHEDDRVRRALIPLLDNDDLGVIYLIGNPTIGYAVVTWSYSIESGGRDALLDEIYVRSTDQGIGGGALDEVLEDLRRRGLPRIFLETEKHNEKVRRFYAHHGFDEEESVWMSLWL